MESVLTVLQNTVKQQTVTMQQQDSKNQKQDSKMQQQELIIQQQATEIKLLQSFMSSSKGKKLN